LKSKVREPRKRGQIVSKPSSKIYRENWKAIDWSKKDELIFNKKGEKENG